MIKFFINKWKKLLQKHGKIEIYRTIMYFTIFILIGYFFIDINIVLYDFANKDLKNDFEKSINPTYLDKNNALYQSVEINYNLTTAGYIRKIVIDLLQIISLLVVFLMIYVHHAFSYYGIKKD